MPESFDTMLAELADAAAESIVPPGLAEVRRRARARTLRRRVTASAIALALIGVVGGGWAAARHQFDRDDGIAPVAGQSTSSSAAPSASSAPRAGSARATPSVSSGGGVYAFTGGSAVVVWRSVSLQNNYLMSFSDGTVALSTAGSFPLCYGRLGAATTSISAVGGATASAAASVSAGVSGAVPASGAVSVQELANVACDDFGTDSGITAAAAGDGSAVWLSLPGATGAASETFSRVTAFGSGGATSNVERAAALKVLVGTWASADGNKRTLQIGVDGAVSYIAYENSGKPYSGSGRIDAAYPNGARAMFGCTGGAAGSSPCQVLLIQEIAKSVNQITVYGSYGAEVFLRKG